MNIFGKKSKKETAPKSDFPTAKVLGVSLEQAVKNNPSFDGIPLPAYFRECLDYVASHGLHLEGIYRVSSPKSRLDELEAMANSDRRDEIVFQDANEAAGLLKRFLRQLPGHILTQKLKPLFEDVAKNCHCVPERVCSCECALKLKGLLLRLPPENYYLLAYVFLHARLVIQQESSNKMGLAAIGVLLNAIFEMSRPLIKTFLLNGVITKSSGESIGETTVADSESATALFDGVDFKPYVKPKSIEEIRLETPAKASQIEDEILKQQNLLEYLHEQIYQMRRNQRRQSSESVKQKEDEMWAVQTGITVLKRRLKALTEGAAREEEEENGGRGGGEVEKEEEDEEELRRRRRRRKKEEEETDGKKKGREEEGKEEEKGGGEGLTKTEAETTKIREKARNSEGEKKDDLQLAGREGEKKKEVEEKEEEEEERNGSGRGVEDLNDVDFVGGGGTNAALLEKQLLAAQMALREEIGEEKRKIAHLLSTLREILQLQAQLSTEEKKSYSLTDSQRAANTKSQQQPPKHVFGVRNGFSENGLAISEDERHWEKLYALEESKKAELLADLIRYRRICSQLRARLEFDTMLVKTQQIGHKQLQQQQSQAEQQQHNKQFQGPKQQPLIEKNMQKGDTKALPAETAKNPLVTRF